MEAIPHRRSVARAAAPGAPHDVITVVAEEIPALDAGQALVRVDTAAANHSEVLALDGGVYSEGLFPVELGYEGAGTVVTAPDAAFPAGARVCWSPVPGSCADYVVVPTALLVPVPDALTLPDAARVATAGVTARLLAGIRPVAGADVLVWGAAGPVGRMLTALLSRAGATVLGVAGTPERAALAHRLGAAHTIGRGTDDIEAAVDRITGGRGVDVVFDPVGAAAYRTNLAVLGAGGYLINYGQLSGAPPIADLTDLMAKGIFVTKFGGGGGDFGLDDLVRLTAETLDLAAHDHELVTVGATFPLPDVAAAYRHLAGAPAGKTLVVPAEPDR